MDAGRITAMIHSSAAKTMTIAQSPSASTTVSRSPWHSPVPYLFGGLAAMLGLIAFALLILACSYWRLSGYLEGSERDLEAGEGSENGGEDGAAKPVFEEKFLVIMAGQQKPTCLATPMSSRASSFGSTSTTSSSATGTSTSTGSCSTVCTRTTVDGENNNEEGSTHISQVEMETKQAHQVL